MLMSDTKVEEKQRFPFVIELNTFSDWDNFLLFSKIVHAQYRRHLVNSKTFDEYSFCWSRNGRSYVAVNYYLQNFEWRYHRRIVMCIFLSPENVTVKLCAFLFIIPKLSNVFLVSVWVNYLRSLDVLERLTSETSSKGAFSEQLFTHRNNRLKKKRKCTASSEMVL